MTSVPQTVDVGTDLEGGTELDVHRGHEVLLLEQEQSLPVDLLGQELGGKLLTTLKKKKKTAENINSEIADTVRPDLRTGTTALPCSEAMKCDTSSVLHSVGLTGRQLWAEVSVATRGGGW